MQRRSVVRAATVAAMAGIAGLAASASGQQTFQRGQDQRWQYGEEQQRQMRQQQQAGRQQQQAGRQQFDPYDFGQQQDDYGYGRQGQQDDYGYGRQAQRQPQQLRQQWMAVQQAQMRGEPRFEDLPLAPEARRMPTRVSQPTQLSGTVTETRTARLIGQPQASQLVKIRTPDGATVFADLGSPQQVRHLQISRGDQIQLSGTPTWLNNQPVIFANRVQTREGMAPIQRGQARQQWQEQRFDEFGMDQFEIDGPGVGQPTQISGTINKTKEVSVGDSEPYLFAYVEDRQGRERLVNLGPVNQVEDVVSEGDEIQVQAISMPLLGQTVYHTQQLRSNGESVRIQQTRLGERGFGQEALGRTQSIRGEVTSKKDFSIGDSDAYLFVRLQDEQGRERLVNLGPINEVDDLISEGDEIQVQAISMPLLGETVYHATQLRANGQTMRVQQVKHQGQMRQKQQQHQQFQRDWYGSGD